MSVLHRSEVEPCIVIFNAVAFSLLKFFPHFFCDDFSVPKPCGKNIFNCIPVNQIDAAILGFQEQAHPLCLVLPFNQFVAFVCNLVLESCDCPEVETLRDTHILAVPD